MARPESFEAMDMSSQQIPSPPKASSNIKTDFCNPKDYISTVLKSQLGNTPEFVAFERYFYYQIEELKSVKSTCEGLRATVSKLQEEKRTLELQVITEKSLRDQESKNAEMEREKLNVQQNARIYTMKCEVESWKRKTETMSTECSWLKEQLKTVEMEKNEANHKLTDLKTTVNDFERYRQSFESYSKRLRETMQNVKKKLDELDTAKDAFEKLAAANQEQLDVMSSKLHSWIDEKKEYEEKIATLEHELRVAKAEIVQNSSKLSRVEMNERKTAELVDKLLENNKELLQGIKILSDAQWDRLNAADKQLVEKSEQLQQQMESNIKRLHLNYSQFGSPPSNSNANP